MDVAANYEAAASKRVGVEAALVRGLQAFIPKYISSLHPDDPLRAIYEQFVAAVKGLPGAQAATGSTSTPPVPATLPLEVIPAFIEFLAGDASLLSQFEDLIGAFAKYMHRIFAASEGDAPSGPDARAIEANAGMNLARLAAVVREAMRESAAPAGREQLASILAMAESVGAKSEGMRIAEWLATPSRPGAENLPVVGFVFEGEARGTLAMHPGVRRRDDGSEETPAGGRLTYEGEGVGRIEIGLEYGDTGFSAVFLVDREDTHHDIQAGLPDLSARIAERGVQVKSLRSVLRRAVNPEQADVAKGDSFQGGLDVKA